MKTKYSALMKDLQKSAMVDSDSRSILDRIVNDYVGDQDIACGFKKLEEDEEVYTVVSTLRNRNLITVEEQKRLQDFIVACFGLSVGSHAVITWMMESRAKRVKILDPDTIDPSNLNRLRCGWDDVGRKKVNVVRETLLKINPFAEVIHFDDVSHMQTMFHDPEVHCIIDAIDDIEGKVFLRMMAKKKRIPLVSAADVGDNVILDIERYDRDPMPKPFLGRIDEEIIKNIQKLSIDEKRRCIIQLVGFDHNSERMLASIVQIGETLPTWPQLGATATIAGGVVATTIKKICLGEDVCSGRYVVSLDELLDASYNLDSHQEQRNAYIQQLKDKFHL